MEAMPKKKKKLSLQLYNKYKYNINNKIFID